MSIRVKFILNISIIVGLTIFLGTASYFMLESISTIHIPLTEKSKNALSAVMELEIHEKNFRNELFEHLEFFKNGSNPHLIEFENSYQIAVKELNDVKKLEESLGAQFEVQEMDLVLQQLARYHDSFFNVADNLEKRGFQDYGFEGKFRNSIHQLETTIHEENDLEMSNILHEIRHSERDFLLRHESEYIERQEQMISELEQKISDSDFTEKVKIQLDQQLVEYKNNFDEVVKIEKIIGFTTQEGKTKEYSDIADSIVLILKTHATDESNTTNEVIVSASTNLILLIIAVIISGIILGIIMSKSISESIIQIEKTKELEKELEISKQKTETEKFTTIGELTSRLAHDLKNPLSIIQVSLDILKHGFDVNEPKQKQIGRIDRSVDRITHQIDDVLDYVRSKPLNYEKVNVSDVISDSLDSVLVPDEVTISLPKNDVLIDCDKRQFTVALNNLILNGIQAINGKGLIEITLKEKDDKIILEIKDSGKGISESDISNLFTPLFTTKQTGTGLGLVSVKSIIEAHGGTISVTSPPTIFTITLPKVSNKDQS